MHPQLTANAGNIALLHRSAELGLIDAELARGAADAYRAMRKLQHQLRLQGREARVEPRAVRDYADRVTRLWQACFG
jgi:glutamate-ammonia-ligase adenylyltransferase